MVAEQDHHPDPRVHDRQQFGDRRKRQRSGPWWWCWGRGPVLERVWTVEPAAGDRAGVEPADDSAVGVAGPLRPQLLIQPCVDEFGGDVAPVVVLAIQERPQAVEGDPVEVDGLLAAVPAAEQPRILRPCIVGWQRSPLGPRWLAVARVRILVQGDRPLQPANIGMVYVDSRNHAATRL